MAAGDSITVSGVTYYQFLVFPSLWSKFNAGVAGTTISDMLASAPSSVDSHYDRTRLGIVSILGGTNGCGTVAASTQWSQLQSFSAARHAVGWKTIVMTIPPQASGCDAALNDLIRANWVGTFDAMADLGAHLTLGDLSDGIHPTPAAQQNIIAPLVQAAINSLIP